MLKWTQDQCIAFECAREVITEMMAIQSGLIYEEEKKLVPNAELISSCRVERLRLSQERSKLHVGDDAVIAELRSTYGEIVRAWYNDYKNVETQNNNKFHPI